jgi:anti-sigma factor RsiW
MNGNCERMRAQFSSALDGTLSGSAMLAMEQHAGECAGCARNFAAWRQMQQALACLRPKPAPADLGLRLRIALSHARAKSASGFFANWDMLWQNTVRPLALQCSAGLASALALLAVVGLMIGMFAVPQRVEASSAKDEPLGMATAPHCLYSMLPTGTLATRVDSAIVVEVFLGADGRVYDYKILAGEDSASVRAQLNSALYFTVFAPARVFGRPVPGHAVMSYAGVAVRG